jgi:hypothetical protein
VNPTGERVEELARWIHGTFAEIVPGASPWEWLPEYGCRYYRHVARALLETPPEVLNAVPLPPEPDAIIGGPPP